MLTILYKAETDLTLIRPDIAGVKSSGLRTNSSTSIGADGGRGAEKHWDRSGPGRGWEKGKVGNYY